MADEATGTEETGGETATETAAPETGQQFDLAPLNERIDDFSSRINERLDGFEQRLPQDQPPEESYQDPYGGEPSPEAMQALEGLYDPQGQMDPQQAQQVLGQMLEPRLQEQIAPLAEQVRALRVQNDAAALEAQYPKLKEPDTAKAVMAAATEKATEIGQPELAGEPWFVELNYLSQVARDAAQTESGTATPGAPVEDASGASPSATETEDDPAQRIVDAKGGPNRPFWGF